MALNWGSHPANTPTIASLSPNPMTASVSAQTLTINSSNFLTGTVSFTAPIPPGGSAYWGLEEALQSGQLLSGAGGAPITRWDRTGCGTWRCH